jgi:hypothetical protein
LENRNEEGRKKRATYLESAADVLDLGVVVDLLRRHNELKDAEAGSGAGLEDGERDAAADVEVLRVADARVLLRGEVAYVGRPLGDAADEDAARQPQLGARALVGGELVLHGHRSVAHEALVAAVQPEGLPARGQHLPVADDRGDPDLGQKLPGLRQRRDALQRAAQPLLHRGLHPLRARLEQPGAGRRARTNPVGLLRRVALASLRRGRRRRGGRAADVERRREGGEGRAGAGVREVGEIESGGRQEQLLHEIHVSDDDFLHPGQQPVLLVPLHARPEKREQLSTHSTSESEHPKSGKQHTRTAATAAAAARPGNRHQPTN